MVTVLDTADIAPDDRAEAMYTAMISASVPCFLIQEESGAGIRARMNIWPMEAMQVFSTESTGIRLVRTAKQARADDAAPLIAFAVQTGSQGRQSHLGHQRLVPQGHLLMMDHSAPYDYAWSGDGASRCIQVSLDQLTLPVDVVRSALPHLAASPLYPMVTDHIAHLTGNIEDLLGDPASAGIEEITLGLTRALIASAARQDRHTRAALAETRLTQIRAYVRRHLTEPDLRPARIAAAHHISERALYKLCAQAGFHLTRWIIEQRLEGAREELAHPSGSGHAVAAVARRWGFSDPTHFSHRFKDAYGISPRDWRDRAYETS
ncbi:helix-turn-helix domain-containing protein [Streptomyces sp. NPDC014861]|uniref:helix-turn-helix domain-containing protein n=1 Tax=Streptomyces sp. NPDC014861 TaxID=3364923 RepID=UPI0036FCBBB9